MCVAGNSVETPRLLLNSASSKYPERDGEFVRSGRPQFMRHMSGTVYAIMPGRVNFERGTQMAGIVKDEARFDPKRGFAGGYEIETLPGFGLAGVATNLIPGAWGREYPDHRDVRSFRRHVAGRRGSAAAGNGVTLHPTEKDQHGLPVPVVHFTDHANDFAMRNHAYKAGRAIYESLGATEVFELPPFPSTHNMGTCRQSENPRDGVCNSYGQSHDIANCLFRTAASSPPPAPRTRRSPSPRWPSGRRDTSPIN